MDDFEKGCIPKKMPFKYAMEMICDYLGAGRAYNKNFTMNDEYNWWLIKREKVKMHNDTFIFVDQLMAEMNMKGIETVLKDKDYMKKLKEEY